MDYMLIYKLLFVPLVSATLTSLVILSSNEYRNRWQYGTKFIVQLWIVTFMIFNLLGWFLVTGDSFIEEFINVTSQ